MCVDTNSTEFEKMTDQEIKLAIEEAYNLLPQMVGTLYPSILRSKIVQLHREQNRRTACEKSTTHTSRCK